MRITPRSEEIAGVKAILESDAYDSADQMAKALVKEVADMLWMRDWYALTHIDITGNKGLNWAPFGSAVEAYATAKRIGIGGRFAAIKLYSPGALLANAEGKQGWKGFCQDPGCGHAPFLHLTNGNARGKCGLTSACACKQYVK